MASGDERVANLWLAEELWNLGGVQFGDFSLGETVVNSPVYVNLRRLISNPEALRRAAEVMLAEVQTLQVMRHPHLASYDLVAGIPFGGLHLATAFSLSSGTPLIYVKPTHNGQAGIIEGVYEVGQRVLIIDDLVTGGRSIAHTTSTLQQEGLLVRDALVLLDRQEGGQARLKHLGVNLVSILTLEAVLNYLGESRKLPEEWYHKSLVYLQEQRRSDP
jgi:orotate phosphoribosyltransferase/uridine monophosphate synthetase